MTFNAFRRPLQAALALLAALVVSGTGWAQQPAPPRISAIADACRADYPAYCAAVPTGGKEATECLQQHAQQVSTPCRDALAHLPTDAQRATMRSACRSDYFSNCFGITPGGQDALMCLLRNDATLSPACRAALAPVR
jgi:Cysteine rich repeat